MMMLMSASACLRFGDLKSFLLFPVSMLFLYCLSDYISLPFTMRVITVCLVFQCEVSNPSQAVNTTTFTGWAGAGLDRVSIHVWLKCLEHQKLPTPCNNKYIYSVEEIILLEWNCLYIKHFRVYEHYTIVLLSHDAQFHIKLQSKQGRTQLECIGQCIIYQPWDTRSLFLSICLFHSWWEWLLCSCQYYGQ